MFSEKLKELRKRKNLTQIQFAKAFGISSGTIAMWETGKRSPDIDTIADLATFFGVSVDFLLGRITEAEDLFQHTRNNTGSKFDKFVTALELLDENGQEMAYDYIDTLVKSGKYSPDSENDTMGIAAKGGITSTTVNAAEADADLDELARRKGF